MERLCVVIYEGSTAVKDILHDVLVTFAVRQNVEIVVRWLKAPIEKKAVCAAGAEAQIALVNAEDMRPAIEIGQLLHSINPECRLVYYGDTACQTVTDTINYFAGLISSCPVRYLHRPSAQEFSESLLELFSEADFDRQFFWETKGMTYRIPYGSILYFRSDRNHVYLHLVNSTEYLFPGKLSNVEKQLPREMFVRVHQSYLVNQREIIAVDKQRKAVRLRNGEELFVSKARYRGTVEACKAG